MGRHERPNIDLELIQGATGDWEVVIGLEVHAQVNSKQSCFPGRPRVRGRADIRTCRSSTPQCRHAAGDQQECVDLGVTSSPMTTSQSPSHL